MTNNTCTIAIYLFPTTFQQLSTTFILFQQQYLLYFSTSISCKLLHALVSNCTSSHSLYDDILLQSAQRLTTTFTHKKHLKPFIFYTLYGSFYNF
jgi:hypothetical protein